MLLRLVDALKLKGITSFFTNLTAGGGAQAQTEVAISSLIDTWLLVRVAPTGGPPSLGARPCFVTSRRLQHCNARGRFE